jgi:hypothetical protein
VARKSAEGASGRASETNREELVLLASKEPGSSFPIPLDNPGMAISGAIDSWATDELDALP